jgi:uncharacterized membrane protein
MAFCVQCGNRVDDADRFCAKCGVPQKGAPRAGAARPAADPFSGISGRNASLLCYIPWVGWIAAIVVLASERFRQDAKVRFHAFQGLYVFVAWLIVEWVVAPALTVSGFFLGRGLHRLAGNVLELMIFAAWIFMMIKVSHDESYKLPVIGDLAERSVSEQRT